MLHDDFMNPDYRNYNRDPRELHLKLEKIKAVSVNNIEQSNDSILLVEEIRRMQQQIHWMENEIKHLHWDLSEKNKVLNAYVEKFWEWKKQEKRQYGYSNTEEEIVLPVYRSEEKKFYDYVMNKFESMTTKTSTWKLSWWRTLLLKKEAWKTKKKK